MQRASRCSVDSIESMFNWVKRTGIWIESSLLTSANVAPAWLTTESIRLAGQSGSTGMNGASAFSTPRIAATNSGDRSIATATGFSVSSAWPVRVAMIACAILLDQWFSSAKVVFESPQVMAMAAGSDFTCSENKSSTCLFGNPSVMSPFRNESCQLSSSLLTNGSSAMVDSQLLDIAFRIVLNCSQTRLDSCSLNSESFRSNLTVGAWSAANCWTCNRIG